MDTQEAQTIINNIKDPNNAQYKKAKAFLEKQQVQGKTEKELKQEEKKKKEEATREWMTNRPDVQNAVRRAQIANPSVGVVDRVTGNVTGLNGDLFDPNALKAKDLNPDGTIAEKDFRLGNDSDGNFIGAEEEKTGKGGNGGSGKGSAGGLDYRTSQFMNKQNAISKKAKEDELNSIDIDKIRNWQEMYDTSNKVVDAYKNIEDKYIQQLPTFMFRRYQNGEFGDLSNPESKKDAQLRLAHFMINGLGTALSNASNVIKGRELEQSDYEKYQNSNLEQGLANRWKKNNAETEEVIKLANKEADNEQDARLYVEQLTRDNNLKNAWNMMDQNQKLFSINVSREIGKLVGDMNLGELSNFITARALDGSLNEQQAVVAGLATLVSKSPEILDKMPDDNKYKIALLKLFAGQ